MTGNAAMNRIIVIGSPGSGKTTLSLALSEALGLPVVHLDRLGWRGNWESVPADEFDAALSAEIAKPRWIIDGNYGRTLGMRLSACDTVIYLDYPRIVCEAGALRRVIRGRGVSRPDMGGNCPERLDTEFLKYIWDFNRTHRADYRSRLQALAAEGCVKVIILQNRRETKRFLKTIKKESAI